MRNFGGFDYILAPSDSCVHRVRDNLDAIAERIGVPIKFTHMAQVLNGASA